jgi:hypothetical protein
MWEAVAVAGLALAVILALVILILVLFFKTADRHGAELTKAFDRAIYTQNEAWARMIEERKLIRDQQAELHQWLIAAVDTSLAKPQAAPEQTVPQTSPVSDNETMRAEIRTAVRDILLQAGILKSRAVPMPEDTSVIRSTDRRPPLNVMPGESSGVMPG